MWFPKNPCLRPLSLIRLSLQNVSNLLNIRLCFVISFDFVPISLWCRSRSRSLDGIFVFGLFYFLVTRVSSYPTSLCHCSRGPFNGRMIIDNSRMLFLLMFLTLGLCPHSIFTCSTCVMPDSFSSSKYISEDYLVRHTLRRPRNVFLSPLKPIK